MQLYIPYMRENSLGTPLYHSHCYFSDVKRLKQI
jgi:hypothetical protein